MNCRKLNFDLDFIDLELDDGSMERYFVTALYEVEGKKYLSLVTGLEEADRAVEDLEGHLFQYVEMDEGEFELLEIRDDRVYNTVAEMIQKFEDQN